VAAAAVPFTGKGTGSDSRPFTQWDDPELQLKTAKAATDMAVQVIAGQNNRVDQWVSAAAAGGSAPQPPGVAPALLAYAPSGADAAHYGGLATLMVETKSPALNDQGIATIDGKEPLGASMQNRGDPVQWCQYVSTLFRVISENYDMSDQAVVANAGPMQSMEMEIDRLIAMSKRWGDLLPFLTKERLMYLCSHHTPVGVPAAVPTKQQLTNMKIHIIGDSSMKLKLGKKGITLAADLKSEWAVNPLERKWIGASLS